MLRKGDSNAFRVSSFNEIVEKEKQVADEKAKASSLESRLKELTDLYRAISAVNSAADPGRTHESVLRAAIQLVGGDCGSIMLPDGGGEHLVIASAQGLDQAVVDQTRQPIGKGIAGWVAENLEPVLLTGTAGEDERFEDLAERDEEVLFSLAAPMVLRNKLIGVINLGSTEDGIQGPVHGLRPSHGYHLCPARFGGHRECPLYERECRLLAIAG